MSHVNQRTQEVGDCYAQAAANLFDAYRFSHGDADYNRQTLAEYSAVEYKYSQHDKDGLEAGETYQTLVAMRDLGACAPDSNLVRSSTNPFFSYDRIVEQLQQLYGIKDLVDLESEGKSKEYKYKNFKEHEEVTYCAASDMRIIKEFPDLNSVLIAFKQDDETKVAQLTFKKLCDQSMKKIQFTPEGLDYGWNATSEQKKQGIDAVLNQTNSQPVEINFDSSVLYNKNGTPAAGKKYVPHPEDLGNGHLITFSDHAATVIGRRRGQDGQCQYLVRDSQGNFCGSGEKKFGDWSCYDGNVWVDAQQLLGSIEGITWIR